MNELEPAYQPGAPSIEGVELISVAGVGGMSIVYKARQTTFSRIVAIKVMHPQLVASNTSLQRFIQEGRLTTTLNHPNIARVYSCGATNGEQQPFLVMEFLEGKSLKEVIDSETALEPDEVKRIFDGVLTGLQFAHQLGIVHRDLKPGNVMLVDDGAGSTVPKIVDFGIAKMIDSETNCAIQRLTQTGAVVGSPSYMSPEQCTAMSVDSRTDIYAVGCMMFEALTGKPPFEADNALSIMTMHCTMEPQAPSAVASHPIPRQFDKLVLKCLAKDPGARYQSAAEVREAVCGVNVLEIAETPAKLSSTSAAFDVRLRHLSVWGVALLAGLAVASFSFSQKIAATDPEIKAWNECERLTNAGEAFAARKTIEGHPIYVLSRDNQKRAAQIEFGLSQLLMDNIPTKEYQRFLDSFDSQVNSRRLISDVTYLERLANKYATFNFTDLPKALHEDNLVDKPYVVALLALRAAHSPESTPETVGSIRKSLDMAVDLANQTQRADFILTVLVDRIRFFNSDRALFLRFHDEIVANDNALLTAAMRTGTFAAVQGAQRLFDLCMSIPEKNRKDVRTAVKCQKLMEEWLESRPRAAPWIRSQVIYDHALLLQDAGKFNDAEPLFLEAIKSYPDGSRASGLYGPMNQHAAVNERNIGKLHESIAHYREAHKVFLARHQMLYLLNAVVDLTHQADAWAARGDEKHAEELRALLANTNAQLDKLFVSANDKEATPFAAYRITALAALEAHARAEDWVYVNILGHRMLSLGKKMNRPDVQAEALRFLYQAAKAQGQTRKNALSGAQ